MSEAERREVVEDRRRKGFPLHSPPHPDLGSGWYLITAATYEHRSHFTSKDELSALESRLVQALADTVSALGGWVVLPNHYHALVMTNTASQLGRVLGRVHARSAQYVNRRDGTPGRTVWYRFADRKVRSERHYWTCLHYIVANPVKHRWCDATAEWPWSCFHRLVERHGLEWPTELAQRYPLLDFGRGWDD